MFTTRVPTQGLPGLSMMILNVIALLSSFGLALVPIQYLAVIQSLGWVVDPIADVIFAVMHIAQVMTAVLHTIAYLAWFSYAIAPIYHRHRRPANGDG